jgi:hypothetical protein
MTVTHIKICEECGEQFAAKRSDKSTCGARCRKRKERRLARLTTVSNGGYYTARYEYPNIWVRVFGPPVEDESAPTAHGIRTAASVCFKCGEQRPPHPESKLQNVCADCYQPGRAPTENPLKPLHQPDGPSAEDEALANIARAEWGEQEPAEPDALLEYFWPNPRWRAIVEAFLDPGEWYLPKPPPMEPLGSLLNPEPRSSTDWANYIEGARQVKRAREYIEAARFLQHARESVALDEIAKRYIEAETRLEAMLGAKRQKEDELNEDETTALAVGRWGQILALRKLLAEEEEQIFGILRHRFPTREEAEQAVEDFIASARAA